MMNGLAAQRETNTVPNQTLSQGAQNKTQGLGCVLQDTHTCKRLKHIQLANRREPFLRVHASIARFHPGELHRSC